LYDQGVGTQEIARQLQISLAWARRVKQERREQGKTANATTRNRQPKWASLVPKIRAAIAAQPDLTLEELQVELGTTLHPGTLCRALQKLKLTFKKKL
jgi:transposase